MTSDELIAYFKTRFSAYKTQVIRLINEKAGIVEESDNTQKLTGKSLDDILAMIRDDVNVHENDHNFPHGETLESMGGTTAGAFDIRAQNYFLKDAVPLTKIPVGVVSANSQLKTVSVSALTVVYYGREVVVPAASLTLTDATTQYIKISFAGTVVDRTAKWIIDANDSETEYLVVVGKVTLLGSTYTPTMFRVVRIGGATLSRTVRGAGIPTSTGSQAGVGGISTDWFQ